MTDKERLLVADIMTHHPVTVAPSSTLKHAVRLMIEGGFRRLPVVEAGGRLVGIVTDRDIRLATDSPVVLRERWQHEYHMTHVTVASCMTEDPITVAPATPVADAIRLMRDHRIGGLPVLMRSELVGIITETDTLDAFLEFLEGTEEQPSMVDGRE